MHDRNAQKNRNGGKLLRLDKELLPKTPQLNSEGWNAFTLRSGTSRGCPLLTSLIQHSAESSSQCNKAKKEKKITGQNPQENTSKLNPTAH